MTATITELHPRVPQIDRENCALDLARTAHEAGQVPDLANAYRASESRISHRKRGCMSDPLVKVNLAVLTLEDHGAAYAIRGAVDGAWEMRVFLRAPTPTLMTRASYLWGRSEALSAELVRVGYEWMGGRRGEEFRRIRRRRADVDAELALILPELERRKVNVRAVILEAS